MNDIFNSQIQAEVDKSEQGNSTKIEGQIEGEKVLCPHCLRTATNGIKCKGICVADSDY